MVQQREAIWDAPMFNKLPVAETTNVNHVDADRLARTRIGASGPATRPNSILRFYKSFEGELKVFDAPSRVFDLRFQDFWTGHTGFRQILVLDKPLCANLICN